jgi:hypothetical protein
MRAAQNPVFTLGFILDGARDPPYHQSMLIYEVNVSVLESRAEEYAEFLNHHIREILAFQGFVSAELLREIRPASDASTDQTKKVQFVVQYRVQSEQDLQHYFDHHAAAMRQDAIQRFGDSFTAHRRNLQVIQSFN